MNEIAFKKQQIDIREIIKNSGVELFERGNRRWVLCPFHPEKTPSFYVKNNHFGCYGCGVYGDVIDFFQQLYGHSFKESLVFLGI